MGSIFIFLTVFLQLSFSIASYNDTINDNESCKKCRRIVASIIQKRNAGASRNEMYTIFNDLCNEYMISGPTYCAALVNVELDTALYIIDNKPDLSPATPCASYLQYLNCIDEDNLGKWSVNLPGSNPPSCPFKTSQLSEVKKVLQLTDVHFDPLYKPGSNAVCSNVPLCCHESSEPVAKPENAAGYWGSYNMCDIPWHSVVNSLDHINTTHKNIDYIYFTGDIISHNGWSTTKEENIEFIRQMFRQLRITFGNIPVFPIIGNHEPHPTDLLSSDSYFSFAPENVTNTLVTTQWLFDVMAEEWSHWLPNSTQETIRKGGFYTFLLQPGLRIIGINSNVCYINNFWLIYNDKDPFGQLQWLSDTLLEAEQNCESVHLLSHVPAGESLCSKFWIHQFNRVIKRFSTTIKVQINGHTHSDEMRVFYNGSNPEQVINVGFNGGSLTTFVGLNPNYRIYNVDANTFEILDYEQWIYNLTEANQHPDRSPLWYKQYSFLDAYNMSKLTLENIGDLVTRLSKNETLLYQYFRYQVRDSDLLLKKGCDEKCLQQKLCRITSIEQEDSNKLILS